MGSSIAGKRDLKASFKGEGTSNRERGANDIRGNLILRMRDLGCYIVGPASPSDFSPPAWG